jgi:hypothetical protein
MLLIRPHYRWRELGAALVDKPYLRLPSPVRQSAKNLNNSPRRATSLKNQDRNWCAYSVYSTSRVRLRHGCGYALANAGHDTRAIQDWLGPLTSCLQSSDQAAARSTCKTMCRFWPECGCTKKAPRKSASALTEKSSFLDPRQCVRGARNELAAVERQPEGALANIAEEESVSVRASRTTPVKT